LHPERGMPAVASHSWFRGKRPTAVGGSTVSGEDGKDFDPNELQTPGGDFELPGEETSDADQTDPLAELGQPEEFPADALADLGGPDQASPEPLADLGQPVDQLPEGPQPLADLDAAAAAEDSSLAALAGEAGLTDLGAASDQTEPLEEPAEEPAAAKKGRKKGKKKEKKKRERKEKASLGWVGFAVYGICGLSILLLLVLDVTVMRKWGLLLMGLMNLFWLVGTLIPFLLWMGRKTLNFFEVMLALSLAGILVALALLLLELVSYGGNVHATVLLPAPSPAVQAAASTTATA